MENTNKYFITYINKDGETQTEETHETEEELQKRIKHYKQQNYKIKNVVKEYIQIFYIDVKY